MAKASKSSQASPSSPRDDIVAAFMALAAEKALGDITLAETAERAGISLGALREAFGSRFEIIAAFVKGVDRTVLDGIDADLADQDIKEKLFDVLMRRLDVLSPHKAAIRNIGKAAMREPGLALALNRLAVRSHHWMLAAAGVEMAGPGGAIRAQGLAVAFGRVVRVWLDDEDPALAKTMRAMDEELARAGRAANALRTFEQLTAPFRSLACAPAVFCAGLKSRRRDRDDAQGEKRDAPAEGWRGDDFRDPKVTPV
jgi:AcrR family transcriptional regulator